MDCRCERPHPPPEDDWRHVVSAVADGVFVTGQPRRGDDGPLTEWESLGVERVIDVTDEGSPLPRPSTIDRVWLPTPDDGSARDPEWLEGIATAGSGTVLVHCHMGVARAPSAAFLLLLVRGWNELDAIEAVMRNRPIAAVSYAADALRWSMGRSVDERRIAALEARRQQLLLETRLALLAAHR